MDENYEPSRDGTRDRAARARTHAPRRTPRGVEPARPSRARLETFPFPFPEPSSLPSRDATRLTRPRSHRARRDHRLRQMARHGPRKGEGSSLDRARGPQGTSSRALEAVQGPRHGRHLLLQLPDGRFSSGNTRATSTTRTSTPRRRLNGRRNSPSPPIRSPSAAAADVRGAAAALRGVDALLGAGLGKQPLRLGSLGGLAPEGAPGSRFQPDAERAGATPHHSTTAPLGALDRPGRAVGLRPGAGGALERPGTARMETQERRPAAGTLAAPMRVDSPNESKTSTWRRLLPPRTRGARGDGGGRRRSAEAIRRLDEERREWEREKASLAAAKERREATARELEESTLEMRRAAATREESARVAAAEAARVRGGRARAGGGGDGARSEGSPRRAGTRRTPRRNSTRFASDWSERRRFSTNVSARRRRRRAPARGPPKRRTRSPRRRNASRAPSRRGGGGSGSRRRRRRRERRQSERDSFERDGFERDGFERDGFERDGERARRFRVDKTPPTTIPSADSNPSPTTTRRGIATASPRRPPGRRVSSPWTRRRSFVARIVSFANRDPTFASVRLWWRTRAANGARRRPPPTPNRTPPNVDARGFSPPFAARSTRRRVTTTRTREPSRVASRDAVRSRGRDVGGGVFVDRAHGGASRTLGRVRRRAFGDERNGGGTGREPTRKPRASPPRSTGVVARIRGTNSSAGIR